MHSKEAWGSKERRGAEVDLADLQNMTPLAPVMVSTLEELLGTATATPRQMATMTPFRPMRRHNSFLGYSAGILTSRAVRRSQ